MTTVERFDDGTGTWVSVDNYGEFEIEFGVSDVLVAPEATITLPRTAPVSAGTRIRIRESGETIFEGNAVRTKPRSNGPMRVDLEHDAYGLFEETVDLSVSGTDRDVLEAALAAASGSWTLAYSGTATTLGDDYEADGRTVKRVFRDMVDRVGRIWWVDVDHTITVAPLGDGGLLASVDTSTDAARVDDFTPDDTDTVVNDVTVIGTGGEKVEGGDDDAGSIDEFGRRPERVNVEYIRSQSEADDYATELLNPEPDASATVTVGASVADVAAPVVNQELDVTDEQGTGMDERLPIESQTVTQGSAELGLGDGTGVNIAKFNRAEKSKADTTEPGSQYGSDRIVDLAITETKIADDSISTPKLQANAVTANEILANSITAGEIDTLQLATGQLAIGTDADDLLTFETETIGSTEAIRIDPAGITTLGESSSRFLRAHFVDAFASELSVSGIIRADSGSTDIGTSSNEFRAIFAESLTASNFVDTDSLSSSTGTVFNDFNADRVLPVGGENSGNVGVTGDYWESMRAGAYFEESPEPLADGDIDLAELCECGWYDPPEYVRRESARKEAEAEGDDDAEADGMGDPAGLELGTVANYLLGVCAEQQSVIDDLAERVATLEADDPNA